VSNLNSVEIPMTLISQYMPYQYRRIKEGIVENNAEALIKDYIYYEIDNDASITYEPVMINDDYDIGDIVSLRTEASIDAPV
ncbi:class II D-tagatose-bisphosphate aldolase, non-catalytic subunit, partial [Erysipelothrix rhusiopathiae]|nr:class II D-tagatose-bisphosphate aldolase, non-catalytic subunit [Erysipelothrix rhusiopathiae]